MSSNYDKPFKEVLSKTLFGIRDYNLVLVVYTFSIGVLSLATPITVQSLVNTFALSTDIQPLFNLSFILLVLLIIFGIIKSFQYITVELMQQKVIAQLSAMVSKKVIFGPRSEFQSYNIREKANRFFEIITIQKVVATLVTDGLSILIQTTIGLILMSLYHPFFIPFNLVIAGVVIFVFRIFNSQAKITAIKESGAKFAFAGFIQDIASSEARLQNEEISTKLISHSDDLIGDYIKGRKDHFKVLFAQNIIYLFLYALVNAILLGLGGYLITIGQLSVGQLVAAEIIVNGISIQLVYSMKHLQLIYDLYASCDKLNWILDLKEIKLKCDSEHIKKIKLTSDVDFKLENVFLGFNNKNSLSLDIKPSTHLEFRYFDSRIKEQLIGVLLKNQDLVGGVIKISGVSYQDISSLEVRSLVYNIDEPLIIDGTIRENLLDFDDNLDVSQIYEVLKKFDLDERVLSFPDKLKQRLHPATDLLSYSQKYRLNLARIYLHNPKLLMIQTGNELFSRTIFQNYLKVFMDTGCSILSYQHDESINDKELFKVNILK